MAGREHRVGIYWKPQFFDSEWLGAPVGRLVIEGKESPASLATRLAELVVEWQRADLWLIACRLPANWTEPAKVLRHCGFRPMETLVTLRRTISPFAETGDPATAAGPNDVQACVRVAQTSLVSDRYHRDPEIDDKRADALKAAWVRNGFAGRADAIFVVRDGRQACGFILCNLEGDEAVIDLIAVSGEARGRGFGHALVTRALAHYKEKAHSMRTGTQSTNRKALSLYRSLGFTVAAKARTLHWINPDAGS